MAIARNWLQTLWRTSYKGAAFWVETDTESGARRIVIHEFPMRDTPYLEDLGERYREFTVTAYVASDRADSEAAALIATSATRGAGILILPTQGAVTVRCTEFSRKFEKDKLGYIAFDLKFVREGATGALASVASLVNMVFIQAEAAATAVASVFATVSLIASVPDYVASALQSGTERALGTLELMRTSVSLPESVSAEQRDTIQKAYVDLPSVISNGDVAALQTIGATIIEAAQAIAENTDPIIGISSFAQILDENPVTIVYAIPVASLWRAQEEKNAQTANMLLRMAALIAYCEAIVKAKITDRPTAITLRANVSQYMDAQLEALQSEEYELFHAMIDLRDATVEYLSRAIIDLAPIVRVSSSIGMPSLYWAWRIYGDPNRSSQLAERNRTPHPSFMAKEFEALAK